MIFYNMDNWRLNFAGFYLQTKKEHDLFKLIC